MRLKALAGAAALALLVAACGGGSAGNATGTKAAGSSGGLEISTANGTPGTHLTDGSGRAVYLWVADSGGKSRCTGACAQAWPPLTAKGMPAAAGGATAGDVGTVTRPGGGTQVTYRGHPLYYYVGDNGPGKITGQGSDDFGAKWWLVAPTGAAVKSG